MVKRRMPRDARYAPNKRIAKLWMRRGGKRRMRRLERHAELEEFDALLDQSSLGTPTAKAIQALTPEDVIDAAARRAASRGSRGV